MPPIMTVIGFCPESSEECQSDKCDSPYLNGDDSTKDKSDLNQFSVFGSGNLLSLRELRLSGCNLTEIPETLTGLDNITVLDLSNNKLKELPPLFNSLNKVRVLNLSRNNFTVAPKCLYHGMCLVKILDLSYNKLKQFNLTPLCFSLLQILKLNCNFLDCFPLWLFQDVLGSLIDVDVSKNPEIFPKAVINMETDRICTTVQTMRLSKCGLTEKRTGFLCYFTNLVSLDLGNDLDSNNFPWCKFQNIFQNIPMNDLEVLKKLTELYVQNVGLPSLDDDISRLANLKVLDISHNAVNWLPESLCDMHWLEKIVASNCGLYFLPCNIGNMKSLKQLLMNENELSSLPGSFTDLENLEVLDLYNNQFDSLPDVSSFKKLKALDISKNYFNLPVKIRVNDEDRSYEEMRNVLLTHTGICKNRLNIRKEVPPDIVPSINYESSDIESHSWTQSECSSENECEKGEEWDSYSGDSDDHFNPNDVPWYITKRQNFLGNVKENKNYFCPFEEQLQFWGTQRRNFNVDEGQFDDP